MKNAIYGLLATPILVGALAAQRTVPGPEPPAATVGSGIPASFVWGDYDGDGLADALAVTPNGELRLLRNTGDGSFEDLTEDAGLAAVRSAAFGVWEDYDGDGQIDLFVGTNGGPSHLFRNRGEGLFEDVAAASGLEVEQSDRSAEWLDYDADGLLDLHLVTEQGNHVYHALGDGLFERVELDLPQPSVRAFGTLTSARPTRDTEGDAARPPARDAGPRSRRGSSRRPLDISLTGLGTGRAPIAGSAAGRISSAVGSPPFLDCLESIADVATNGCLVASSTPTAGTLYPYPGLNNVFVPQAFVGGGENNQAIGPWSTVGGGRDNTAVGIGVGGPSGYAFVGGGHGNQATGRWSTVAGGRYNTASGYSGGQLFGGATVGGGYRNAAAGSSATVGGGSGNIAPGISATVGGGRVNAAYGSQATVGGGSGNRAAARTATVAGGDSNSALASAAAIGGGQRNRCDGLGSTIGGGYWNTVSGRQATVGGGHRNTASGVASAIAGGRRNASDGLYAMVGGGRLNTASGPRATVGGGVLNVASGSSAAIPGGSGNRAMGDFSFAAGRFARADHRGAFVWGDSQETVPLGPIVDKTSSTADEFNVYCSGGARFFTDAGATTGVLLAAGGGSWSSLSDRDSKENVEPIDGRRVLERLAAVPMATWNYKAQDDSIRHMGPMAQDFRAAFGLGISDELIDTIDADGVALAAIQGLNAKLEERLAEKDAEIADLRAQVETLMDLRNGAGRP